MRKGTSYRRWPGLLGLPALLAIAACGGGDAEPLDCAWLAQDNCYKRAIRAISECAPGAGATGESGTFDAARTSCTYPDGTTISFDEPVPEDPVGDDDYLWRFSIDGAEGNCVRFEESDNGFEIMGPTGNVRASGSIGGYKIECPDGTAYRTGDPFSLFECTEDDAVLPSTNTFSSGGSVSVGLGAPEGVDGTLFRCE